MPDATMPVEGANEVTHRILAHYRVHARDLPWRSAPGMPPPDPYAVWLSEIMLQQTTVTAVKPYFAKFLGLWGDVTALAAAEDAAVMRAWAGLGYYARARNLLACARAVVAEYGGAFPHDEAQLRALPGIGIYTAAAIAAIAFGKRAVVVDGNVERVIARYFAVEMPLPAAKPVLREHADSLTPDTDAGDFAQAMMDLGATLCTPRNPACDRCPIMSKCAGRLKAEQFPVKPPKRAKREREGTVWWIERAGQVLLVDRPSKGLLGGMAALPTCDWRGRAAVAPLLAEWYVAGQVDHVFTHFTLKLRVKSAHVTEDVATALGGRWWPIDRIEEAGLPSVFAKAAQRALGLAADQ
jgi:A/G-specific adenine glycosylase